MDAAAPDMCAACEPEEAGRAASRCLLLAGCVLGILAAAWLLSAPKASAATSHPASGPGTSTGLISGVAGSTAAPVTSTASTAVAQAAATATHTASTAVTGAAGTATHTATQAAATATHTASTAVTGTASTATSAVAGTASTATHTATSAVTKTVAPVVSSAAGAIASHTGSATSPGRASMPGGTGARKPGGVIAGGTLTGRHMPAQGSDATAATATASGVAATAMLREIMTGPAATAAGHQNGSPYSPAAPALPASPASPAGVFSGALVSGSGSPGGHQAAADLLAAVLAILAALVLAGVRIRPGMPAAFVLCGPHRPG